MLGIGVFWREFPISGVAILSVLGSALVAQAIAIWKYKLPWNSLLSALISGLSLLLLFRSNYLLVWSFAAVLAVASKFIFRWRGKHFFNPTDFALVSLFYLTPWAWFSPGQWGDDMTTAFWVVLMGAAVVSRARRFDISLAFFFTFVALLFARVTYLGQNAHVLPHQLADGGLILFTFFMVSDPRSTPDHRVGRLIFGASVAILTFFLRFHWYHPGAPFEALFLLSPLTIILDSLWNHSRFEWASRTSGRQHETQHLSHLVPST